MSTNVQVDAATGSMMFTQEHRFLVTFIDDSMYLGLMVWLYDATGINTIFLDMRGMGMLTAPWMEALQYGLMFGSMLEFRKWLEAWGVHTDVSYWFARMTGWNV